MPSLVLEFIVVVRATCSRAGLAKGTPLVFRDYEINIVQVRMQVRGYFQQGLSLNSQVALIWLSLIQNGQIAMLRIFDVDRCNWP